MSAHEIGALVMLVNEDRLSEAERGARALLTLHPDAGMIWKVLSVALLRQGRDALQALRKTAELMPQDAEAHGNLGAALHDSGQWAEALESLHRALAIQPNLVEALVDAANALRELGRAREAVPLYRRALQVEPRLAEAHNNLGNAFLDLAQPADAAACYRCALQLRPDDPQILCNLGSTLRQLGNLDEAMTFCGRAIALDPTLSVAHNCLGLIHAARGQREEAVASYRQALALNFGYVEALNNLGNALFELRRTQEAVASYRRALALQPDYAPAHLSLALAMRQQRRPTDAESSCQAALAIDPNYVEALSFLGELRADRGRFAEAEELFQRAIALNPDYSHAYFSIATHRKMTTADGAWFKGVEALLDKRLPLGHEISLRYALGKYFDDLEQHDRAFDNYRRANEATKRYGSTYSREKLGGRVAQIMRRFDSAFIRRHAATASVSELPVFIVGMPRSGTSLAEQILASHPAVFGAGELPFWDAAFGAYMRAELKGAIDARLLPGMAADYLDRVAGAHGAAASVAAASVALSSGGPLRVVDKMPANFLYAGLIHAAFPRARIIHMQRHPLDTCLSIYFQNFFSMGPYANDLDNLAHYYGEYVRITDHWRTVLPATALLEVPYEALIEDQEGWTRRMLDFVGLPWDSKCLDFHQTDRVVITASKWQVRQKVYSASVGRWRHYEKFLGPLQRLMRNSTS